MKGTLFLLIVIISFTSCQKSNDKDHIQSMASNGNDSINVFQQENPKRAPQIVPGKRLGDIALGNKSSDVTDKLGEPIEADAAMGKSRSTYSDPDGDKNAIVTIFSSRHMGGKEQDGYLVESVRSTSSKYKSPDGLRVGSSLKEIMAVYKLEEVGSFMEENNHYILYDTSEGIAFEIGVDKKCHGILIHNLQNRAAATYLPIYADFKWKDK